MEYEWPVQQSQSERDGSQTDEVQLVQVFGRGENNEVELDTSVRRYQLVSGHTDPTTPLTGPQTLPRRTRSELRSGAA